MDSEILAPLAEDDALAARLRDVDGAIRSAAAQALGAVGTPGAAPALVAALLDEDPDVRVDAMAALVRLARPEDAPALRRSLAGDPVGEVKTAAIRALARLGDREAVPLLRRLARERAEDAVAWEDTGDVWDDWLDVQVAAVEALGRLGAGEAVDDLLAARADEFGQDLDDPVFAALAALPGAGPDALLRFLRHRDPRTRRRAVAALRKVAADRLRPLAGVLLSDRDGAVRALAIPAIGASEDAARRLCLDDGDPAVRRAALAAFAAERPDLASAALADPDDACRAVAIRALAVPERAEARDDLLANLEAWIPRLGPATAIAALERLAGIGGQSALASLIAAAGDAALETDVRVTALRLIGREAAGSARALAALTEAATDRSRQLRMTALVALAQCADAAPRPVADAAAATLVGAISGELLAIAGTPGTADMPHAGPRAAPGSPPSPDEVRITPDGGIVAATPQEVARARHRSTLAALVPDDDTPAPPAGATSEDDDLLHGGDAAVRKPRAGGRHRVSVDGPDDVAADLRINALGAARRCGHRDVVAAIVDAAQAQGAEIRRAAFEALSAQAETAALPDIARDVLVAGMADPEAAIRLSALRAVRGSLASEEAAGLLGPLLADRSGPVRAAALIVLGQSDPERLVDAMAARERVIRDAALEGLLALDCRQRLERGVARALEAGRSDILARAASESGSARRCLVRAVGEAHSADGVCLTALRALAGVRA